MNDDDVVPLPEHLLSCGCPRAAHGTHLTSCVLALAHDATPLSARPEYPSGRRRFQAINWSYPLRLSMTVSVTLEVDPVAYIANHLDEYDAFTIEPGYQPWEKPMVFLSEQLGERIDELGWSFNTPRHVAHVAHLDSYASDVECHPRWTSDDTDRLDARLAPLRVDPNQGALDV